MNDEDTRGRFVNPLDEEPPERRPMENWCTALDHYKSFLKELELPLSAPVAPKTPEKEAEAEVDRDFVRELQEAKDSFMYATNQLELVQKNLINTVRKMSDK